MIAIHDNPRNRTDLQAWTLDALGNWDKFSDGRTTQTRDQDAANETTHISGPWVDPVYDAAGNVNRRA